MSGGSLNYFYAELEDHCQDLGDKELNELVLDLSRLFKDREWYLSSDTGIGQWNEARDAFKDKWFTQHGRQERIEKYIADFEDEVRKTFGISDRYCRTCKHWTKTEYDGRYVRCEFHKNCLMHRSESCDKWEKRENI